MAKKIRRRIKSTEEEPAQGPPASRFDELRSRIRPVSEIDNGLKILLYGRSGTGKTTIASTFPGPTLLLDVREEGTDSVYDIEGIQVLPVQSWDDIELTYWMLATQPHNYKTVIIDTISMAQVQLVRDILEKEGREAMSQQLWGEVSGKMQTVILGYRDLPMNVVFLAHDRIRESEEGEDDTLEPEVGPALIPSVAKTLNGAVSIVGNTYVAEKVTQVKGKVKRRIEYRVRLGPHAFYTTKVRKPKGYRVPSYVVDATYEKLLRIRKGEYDGTEE